MKTRFYKILHNFSIILLLPHIFGIRNRILVTRPSARVFIILIFLTSLMGFVYQSTLVSIRELSARPDIAWIPSSGVLSIIFMSVGGLMMFSSAVSCLGTLYLSNDLPLLISSPIKPFRLFFGKWIEVFFTSSWMVLACSLPLFAAFSVHHNASWYFMPSAFFILLLWLIIPCGVSLFFILALGYFLPAHRTREFFFALGAFSALSIVYIYKTLFPSFEGASDSFSGMIQTIRLFSASEVFWNPARWCAIFLGEQLEPSSLNTTPYLLAIIGLAVSAISLSFIGFKLFHHVGYSMSQSKRVAMKINSINGEKTLRLLTFWMPSEIRAIFGKDIRFFIRDIGQTAQLVLLLGLCLLYIYNFKVLQVIDTFPLHIKIWWQGIILIGNIGMGSFVIAAISARFVFPATSLEGRSIWILQVAPIKPQTIYKAKFITWYPWIGLVSCVLLSSGAMALNADANTIFITAFLSWIISFGVVALGIGFGKIFANFDWDRSSQLSASFGSLVFMIAALLFIAAHLAPVSLIIFLKVLSDSGAPISTIDWIISLLGASGLIIYMNIAAARWALK